MNEKNLRTVSWYLLGVTACIQASSMFIPVFHLHAHYRIILPVLSALLLAGGAYVHVRSKGYQPFKQWQIYAFPLLAYQFWFAAFLVTLGAMWLFARLPQASEAASPHAGEKDPAVPEIIGTSGVSSHRPVHKESVMPKVIGGIAGLAVGLVVMKRLGEGLGDSPGAGIGLLCMAAAMGVIGAVIGASIGIVRDARAGRPWKAQAATAAALVLVFGALAYGQMLGAQEFRKKMHDRLAEVELRNARTAVEAFQADHDRYPKDLVEFRMYADRYMNTKLSPDVEFDYLHGEGKPDAFELRAYHKRGKDEFMVTSKQDGTFYRDRSVSGDWFRLRQ